MAVAERQAAGLGLAIVGRGFDAAVAVPLRGTMIEALPHAGQQVAAACPTGAFAVKGEGGGCCPMARWERARVLTDIALVACWRETGGGQPTWRT